MHGAIMLDTAWLVTALLLSLRLSPVLLLTPVLGATNVPVSAKVLIVLALSGALSVLPLASQQATPSLGIPGVGAVIRAGAFELALGATLALGVLLAFAACSMAGELLGVQIGFGLGQVIDPSSNASVPILSSAYTQLTVVLFFLLGGHHTILRGMAFSLERFPLGRPWPLDAALAPTLRLVSAVFTLGFALAAPVAVLILLVDIALSVIARQLPQVNMLAMGIPLKIVVGLLALSLWFGRMGAIVTRVYDAIYRTWNETFQAVSISSPRSGPVLARSPSTPSREGSHG